MKTVQIEIQSDLVSKLSSSQPIQAISELVWNSFDADASKVSIHIQNNSLGFLEKITVKDNGEGIEYDRAEEIFKNLGGSWKRNKSKTKSGRFLHGEEGKGRFKALSLGRVVNWDVTYKKNGKLFNYSVKIISDKIREAVISDEKEVSERSTGVIVTINEPLKDFSSLLPDNAIQPLTENFALYLKDYKSIEFYYDGTLIDPDSIIESQENYELSNISDEEGLKYTAELEIIEWKATGEKKLFLCNKQGFPYTSLTNMRFHTGDFKFSAYIKSDYFKKLYQDNILDISELKPEIVDIIEEARNTIKAYFIERAASEASTLVQKWKDEKIYPYKDEATSAIEKVERQVFDIVAVNINDNLPDFSDIPVKNRKLNLQLLKQALEKDPSELQLILEEVLNLPKKKQKELAELLRNTELSALINASKLITDRLKFLTGLEEIVFDTEIKKYLLERSQLHKILADNTWIFGEEFNISVDDQSLTEVLKKHKELLNEDLVIDTPVKRIDETTGIIDLMLSRSLKTNRDDEIEHLIVELKRPSVIIGNDETSQIESYAMAVAEDERFKGLDARWDFWVISNDLDAITSKKVTQRDRPKGLLYESDRGENPEVRVWVKTWSTIIKENKARLNFVKEKLEYQADKGEALKTLKETYSELLENTKTAKAIDEKVA